MFKRLLLSALLAVTLLCGQAHAADISITAANVVPSSKAVRHETTAGVSVTAGQLIYQDATDTDSFGRAKAKLSDADGAAALRVVDGIAINSASAGQPLIFVSYDPALVIGGSQTANLILILSNTPGGIAPSADLSTGEYLVVIGVVKSATTIFFRAPGLASGVAQ